MAEPTTPAPVRREALWLWAVVALILLAIVIVLGARACDDDEGPGDSVTPTATETGVGIAPSITESTPETTPGGPEPDPLPPGSRRGTLLANGDDLYPFLGGNLLRLTGSQVEGSSVRVIVVVGDESFWVGRSDAQRLLIVLNLSGEPPPRVAAGQSAQFVGQIVDNAGEDYGVTDDEGLQLLRRRAITPSSAFAT